MPPEIVLRTPNAMFVGEDIDVDLEVTAEADTRIDFVEARVLAVQGWAVGSGKNRVTRREKAAPLIVRLADAGILPAGTTRFAARFALPATAPPTHDLDPAYAHVDLKVRVSIPWRFDGRETFRLAVRKPPHTGAVVRTPMITVGRSGAAPDAPRLEVALASTRVIAGEILTGSCAVFHLPDAEPRPVDLALVPTLTLKGRWIERERRGEPYRMTLILPAHTAGSSVPFEIRIPREAIPGFDTTTHTLGWRLHAASGGFFGPKVSVAVPLEVVDASAAASTAALTVAPRLADERVAAAFAQFADRSGWRFAGGRAQTAHDRSAPDDNDDHDDDDAGSDPRQPAIEHDIRASRVRIAYRYRGEAGTFLVGALEHAPLGLDLAVSRGFALRDMFFADIEAGVPAWDRAYHVAARSADQTAPVLRAVVPSLTTVSALGTMVRWTDDAMVFERAVTTVDPGELEAMAVELVTLVGRVEAAAAAIAPPTGLTVDLDAWRELARWLRGSLTPGDLAIDGALDELPVEIRLLFTDDGVPTGVRAAIGAPNAAPAAVRDVAFALARPWQDAIADPAAQPALAELVTWPKDVVELRVADGVALATWQLGPDHLADPARVRALVLSLRTLLAALAPSAGPYR